LPQTGETFSVKAISYLAGVEWGKATFQEKAVKMSVKCLKIRKKKKNKPSISAGNRIARGL
jgi:uncharacterized protein (DUF2384 family)